MTINSQSVNGQEIADMLQQREGEWIMCKETSKVIQYRNEYIHNKMIQLDQVTDARKHTHRLARIMKYHELLTNVEVFYARQRLHTVFGSIFLKGCEDKWK